MPRSWLKPCRVREMSVAEAAWLSGFMDGEGSIFSYMAGRKRAHKTWAMSAPNTCEAALVKCREITGTGTVALRTRSKTNRLPMWIWRVSSQRDVAEICRQILPYSVIKAEKILNFLNEWTDIEGNVGMAGLEPASS